MSSCKAVNLWQDSLSCWGNLQSLLDRAVLGEDLRGHGTFDVGESELPARVAVG